MGDTYTECANNAQKTCNLLESLGFIINYSKSKILPSQRCKYLGFIFDSSSMSLELPEERRVNVKHLIDKFSGLTQFKIRDFAEFIGLVIACCPALKYSWMYTKDFERQKFLALNANKNNYDATMILELNKTDVNWWKTHILSGVNSLELPEFSLEIFSDASLSGFGAVCGDQRVNGFWIEWEQRCSINYLFNPSIQEILLFRTHQYEKGVSHRTIILGQLYR